MAGRGAPVGNQNGAKGRRWAIAIDEAFAVMDKSRSEGVKTINALAEKLITMGLEGDLEAIKEIGNRLDGKAKQQVELSADQENPLSILIGQMAKSSIPLKKNDD